MCPAVVESFYNSIGCSTSIDQLIGRRMDFSFVIEQNVRKKECPENLIGTKVQAGQSLDPIAIPNTVESFALACCDRYISRVFDNCAKLCFVSVVNGKQNITDVNCLSVHQTTEVTSWVLHLTGSLRSVVHKLLYHFLHRDINNGQIEMLAIPNVLFEFECPLWNAIGMS